MKISELARYVLALVVVGGFLLYSTSATISGDFVSEVISEKLPKTVEKKKFLITVEGFQINSIENKVVNSTVSGKVKPTEGNFISSFFNKEIPFQIETETVPKIQGSKMSLSLRNININNTLKVKEVKGTLRKIIENIEITSDKLESASVFLKVKGIEFQDNGELLLKYKLSWWILFLILPFLFLREIGLLLIAGYQKFLSPKKGYKCAKGVLHQNGTCSSCVKDAFREGGFFPGMKEYFKTTKECRAAYEEIKRKEAEDNGKKYTKKDAMCDTALCAGCDGSPLLFGSEATAITGVEAGGCEIAGCEAGACDVGGCEMGSCEIGSC